MNIVAIVFIVVGICMLAYIKYTPNIKGSVSDSPITKVDNAMQSSISYPTETVIVNKNKTPITTKSGLIISYTGAVSRSYSKGGGATVYSFSLKIGNNEGAISFTDTQKNGDTVVWGSYTITYVTSDPNTFTFKINTQNNIYKKW